MTPESAVEGAEALMKCSWVNLNSTDSSGRTALHYATLHQDFTIGYGLLVSESGRSEGHMATGETPLNQEDLNHDTPISLARLYNNPQAIATLKLFGARENATHP